MIRKKFMIQTSLSRHNITYSYKRKMIRAHYESQKEGDVEIYNTITLKSVVNTRDNPV